MGLQLTEEDLLNEEVLGSKLLILAEIVVRKHFYSSYNKKDDLVSVAVLKAMIEIRKNNFDKSRGAFHNYIYTGMRNEVHNFLYHENKYVVTENIEKIEESYEPDYFDDGVCLLDIRIIRIVCNRLRRLGKDLEKRVILRLRDMGFHISGIPDEALKSLPFCDIDMDSKYDPITVKSSVDRICGIVVWECSEKRKRDAND